MARAYNPSSQEAEAKGSLQAGGQPHLYSKTLSPGKQKRTQATWAKKRRKI